jgi:hypothetical protein
VHIPQGFQTNQTLDVLTDLRATVLLGAEHDTQCVATGGEAGIVFLIHDDSGGKPRCAELFVPCGGREKAAQRVPTFAGLVSVLIASLPEVAG